MTITTRKVLTAASATLLSMAVANTATALEIDSDQSNVTVVSTKVLADGTQSVAEIFSFDNISGNVNDDGAASVAIDLDTINTGIDIRNERMSEFLFNTEKYPEATITAQIPESAIAEGTRTMDLDISLDMHGGVSEYTVPVLITSDAQGIKVIATKPVLVDATAFELNEGLGKLGELAGLALIPSTVPVSFSLAFDK